MTLKGSGVGINISSTSNNEGIPNFSAVVKANSKFFALSKVNSSK